MQYEKIAEGSANVLYRRSDGVAIRVSKQGTDPALIADYWSRFWRAKFPDYMGDMTVTNDPRFGRVLQVHQIGATGAARIIAEFKPKWLAQSPGAPKEARACRTCAVKAMRNHPIPWCSLDVAHKDRLDRLARSIAREPQYEETVMRALTESPLLDHLRDWQIRLAESPESLRDCMSLRDCTVIVEHEPAAANTRLWLVDLDPKLGDAKLAKWEQIEAQLQPYYRTGTSACRLSRQL